MAQIIDQDFVFTRLPVRPSTAHKGTFGKVLCVCGSTMYRGAGALCVQGALRTGAGIVTLAAPECVIACVASHCMEATYLPLPNDGALRNAIETYTSIVAGCGLVAGPETAQQMLALLEHATSSVVLDASGLVSLAPHLEAVKRADCALVITPHIGEAATLLGVPIAQVLQCPEATARTLAQKTGAVTVLKQHCTIIAAPDGQYFENHTGNAGLARGGSGDILAGMIGALLAQGLSAIDAACCAVFLHGSAADACAIRKSKQGMLPSDILTDLCNLFLVHERAQQQKEMDIHVQPKH